MVHLLVKTKEKLKSVDPWTREPMILTKRRNTWYMQSKNNRMWELQQWELYTKGQKRNSKNIHNGAVKIWNRPGMKRIRTTETK